MTELGKHTIVYIDRVTKERHIESVYAAQALQFLYGDGFFTKLVGKPLLRLISRNRLFSYCFGLWQKQPWTRHRIAPFIKKFGINPDEFLDQVETFPSFNDFFIRKLKTEVRPIAPDQEVAIIPADGRYYFYQNIDAADGFVVKGEKFSLTSLLNNENLAEKYQSGAMVIARLCPTDYHRFHFPVDCVPSEARLINGWLYSVNPIALRKNLQIFVQNKRMITTLKTDKFGEILFIEIGATSVGSIIQTYQPHKPYLKGEEKGYFSFGASSLILLFPPQSILFDEDLLEATRQGVEMKCLLGQPLGTIITTKRP